MITIKDNTIARAAWRRRCGAGLLAVGLTAAWVTELMAQEPRFGIAPSARTQRAVSDAPTRSDREDQGLYAAVGVAYSHRSNVRRESVEEDGPERDSAVVVTPQAGYKRNFGRHTAEVGVTTQFTRFQDLTDENTANYTVDGLANLDITRILDLDLFASYTDAAEPRGGSGTRAEQSLEPDQVEITGYGGQFTLGRRAARLQLQAGADRSQWRYQNNQQQFRDRDDDRVHGRVIYNISPRTSVFAGASLTDVSYQQSGLGLDSEELGYDVGARWDITAKTSGRVSVGRTEKDFDDPLLEDVDTTTLAGRLSWTPRRRTTFNLYGSRQFEETASTADNYFISELIGASISQSFGSRLDGFAYINETNDDYASGRRDEILDYGLGVNYSFRRWLSLGAEYSIIERDSNIPGNDYEDEVLSLLLNGNFGVGSR